MHLLKIPYAPLLISEKNIEQYKMSFRGKSHFKSCFFHISMQIQYSLAHSDVFCSNVSPRDFTFSCSWANIKIGIHFCDKRARARALFTHNGHLKNPRLSPSRTPCQSHYFRCEISYLVLSLFARLYFNVWK